MPAVRYETKQEFHVAQDTYNPASYGPDLKHSENPANVVILEL